MKLRNTIWLLGLAAAVVAWIYWQERHGARSTREETLMAGRIVEVEPADVREIRIMNGTSLIELVRHGTQWRMIRPITDRADRSAVGALLDSVETLHSRETLRVRRKFEKNGLDLDEIGLTQPKTQIALEQDGLEAPIVISFGRETPYSGTIYARVNEEEVVHVVENGLRDLALEDARAFRDRSLVGPLSVDEVSRILLRRQSGVIELTREKGKWRMLRPSQSAAQSVRIEKILKSIEQCRIIDFGGELPEQPSPSAFEGQEVGVSLFVSQDEPFVNFVIREGGDSGQVVVEDLIRKTSVTVDAGLLRTLLVSPMVLRDAALLKVELDGIDAITMIGSGQRLRLVRSEDQWIIDGKDAVQADPTLIEALVGLLGDDENVEIIAETASSEDLDVFGFKNPALRIEFASVLTENALHADAGEHLVGGVEFGGRVGDRVYARNFSERSVSLIPATRLEAIDLKPEFWEDRRFIRCDPDEVVEVAVRNRAGVTFRWSSMDGTEWTQRSGSRKINEQMVASLVDTLCALRHSGEAPRPKDEADFTVELSRWNPDLQESKKEPRLRIWLSPDSQESFAQGGVVDTTGWLDPVQLKFLIPLFSKLQ